MHGREAAKEEQHDRLLSQMECLGLILRANRMEDLCKTLVHTKASATCERVT